MSPAEAFYKTGTQLNSGQVTVSTLLGVVRVGIRLGDT